MNPTRLVLVSMVVAGLLVSSFASGEDAGKAGGDAGGAAAGSGSGAPQVFLDKPPKVVAFQLKRLTNAQLVAIQRNADEAKYKPVYEAILVRKGLERTYREEAVAALAKLNGTDPVLEILAGIGNVEKDDAATVGELAGLLMAQSPEALAAQREKVEALATQSQNEGVKQAAFAALAVADKSPEKVWQLAQNAGPGGLRLLLGGLAVVPDAGLRQAFYPLVKPLVAQAPDEETRVAAIEAISYLPGNEAEAFGLLAELVAGAAGAPAEGPEKVAADGRRRAAVRSMRRIPADKWPAEQVGPVARAIVELVEQTPADQRTTIETAEAVQLGEELSAAMPAEEGAAIRKSLRELAVRTVVLHTLKEQMMYDLRYFTVEAGKPVQIILDNTDSMPHNVVVVMPGALQEVGVAGGSMQPPADPEVKPFVPENENVLEATHLVQPGQTTALAFDAPEEPGEYIYLCTYPGHWIRMYGVLNVVEDLEAWEQSPEPPADPLTGDPIEDQRNTPLSPGEAPAAAAGHEAHQH